MVFGCYEYPQFPYIVESLVSSPRGLCNILLTFFNVGGPLFEELAPFPSYPELSSFLYAAKHLSHLSYLVFSSRKSSVSRDAIIHFISLSDDLSGSLRPCRVSGPQYERFVDHPPEYGNNWSTFYIVLRNNTTRDPLLFLKCPSRLRQELTVNRSITRNSSKLVPTLTSDVLLPPQLLAIFLGDVNTHFLHLHIVPSNFSHPSHT